MAVEAARGALPLPVAFDEDLERAQQLAGVARRTVALERAEDRVAERAQGVVVLEGEQQLEGAEVAVGEQAALAGRVQRGRLERPARLVVTAAGVGDSTARPAPATRSAPSSAPTRTRTRSPSSNSPASSAGAGTSAQQ